MDPTESPSPGKNDRLLAESASRLPTGTGARPGETRAAESEALVVEFDSLAQGRKDLFISYQGQLYRLSTTRNGKLILTK